MLWLLVGEGVKEESGQAFGSGVLIGSKRLECDTHEELLGILSHELAHVALDHSRSGASMIAALITLVSSGLAVLGWMLGSALSLLSVSIGAVALLTWCCLVNAAVLRGGHPGQLSA
jgi:Zn-dependent protease with chaperone function